MNDDDIPEWEKKYWANREAQLAQKKATAPASQAGPRFAPVPQMNNYPEIDPIRAMQQKMANDMMYGPSNGGGSTGQRSVFLREGADYYAHLKGSSGFGSTIPLIRGLGKLSGVMGKEFVIISESVRCYKIDGLPVVDLGKANEQPERYGTYVQVRAPFIGDILVEKNAIIETQYNSGRQLLRG